MIPSSRFPFFFPCSFFAVLSLSFSLSLRFFFAIFTRAVLTMKQTDEADRMNCTAVGYPRILERSDLQVLFFILYYIYIWEISKLSSSLILIIENVLCRISHNALIDTFKISGSHFSRATNYTFQCYHVPIRPDTLYTIIEFLSRYPRYIITAHVP